MQISVFYVNYFLHGSGNDFVKINHYIFLSAVNRNKSAPRRRRRLLLWRFCHMFRQSNHTSLSLVFLRRHASCRFPALEFKSFSKQKKTSTFVLAFLFRRRRDLLPVVTSVHVSLLSQLTFSVLLPLLFAPFFCHRQRSQTSLSCRFPALKFKSFSKQKRQALLRLPFCSGEGEI